MQRRLKWHCSILTYIDVQYTIKKMWICVIACVQLVQISSQNSFIIVWYNTFSDRYRSSHSSNVVGACAARFFLCVFCLFDSATKFVVINNPPTVTLQDFQPPPEGSRVSTWYAQLPLRLRPKWKLQQGYPQPL